MLAALSGQKNKIALSAASVLYTSRAYKTDIVPIKTFKTVSITKEYVFESLNWYIHLGYSLILQKRMPKELITSIETFKNNMPKELDTPTKTKKVWLKN